MAAYGYDVVECRCRLQKLIDEGLTTSQMAIREGVSATTMRKAFKTFNLKSRYAQAKQKAKQKYRSTETINHIRRRLNEGASTPTIAKELGCANSIVWGICERHGFKATRTLQNQRLSQVLTEDFLKECIRENMCAKDIGRKVKCKADTVQTYLNRFQLKAPFGNGWRSHNGFSRPCNHLRDTLTRMGLSFVPEFHVLEQRRFLIDIAFPELKLGIEVNGTFHYQNRQEETLTTYHQERHNLITQAGWILIEVPYDRVWNEDYVSIIIARIQLAQARIATS